MAVLAAAPAMAGESTDAAIAAHRAALDLSGAFTNDGFKLRDGDYEGTLETGKSAVIQVNLYAGNQYWFAVSTADAASKLSLAIYDETGKLLKTEPFATQADASKPAGTDADAVDPDAIATNRAAAGFAPEMSGPYYVRIINPSKAPATFSLIYSYK